MKDMTEREARDEAFRRWGPRGVIEYRPRRGDRQQRGRLARYPYTVSDGAAGTRRSVEGQGESWRAAFEDARPR